MSKKRDADGFELPQPESTVKCEFYDEHSESVTVIGCTTDESNFSGEFFNLLFFSSVNLHVLSRREPLRAQEREQVLG
jgi:hypothetical protein